MNPITLRGGSVLHFYRDGNDLCGRATVYTRFGPQHITARVDLVAARKAVQQMLRTHAGQQARAFAQELIASGADDDDVADSVEGFFDDVGDWFKGAAKTIEKGVRSVAKSSIFRDITAGVNAALDNPITGPLITAIPYVGPALQVTAKGAALIAAAYQGHPKAKKAIKRIHQRAAAGDPKAKSALAKLRKIRAEGLKAAAARTKQEPQKPAIRFTAKSFTRKTVEADDGTDVDLDTLLEVLAGMRGGGLNEPEGGNDQIAGDTARRVEPHRYDAMTAAYRASGYQIGASGLPLTLEAGADGVYRMPRLRSYRGHESTYGLRVV